MTTKLEETYRLHADELIRYATTLVGPDRAHDVVTDAFLKVFDHGTDDVEHLRAYLFRAVYRRAVDVNRSRDRRRRREERDGRERLHLAPGPPSVSAAVDARDALDVLTDQQRAVVFLTYWRDRTASDVADLLGVSEGTVKQHLARARKKMREVLDDGTH